MKPKNLLMKIYLTRLILVLDKIGNKLVIADSAEPRLIADLKHLGVNIKPVKK